MRTWILTAALLAAAAPVAAQQHSHTDHRPAGAGAMPAGWQGRVDRANQKVEDVSFQVMAPGYHVTTGPAVILWQPVQTAAGAYTLTATFQQMKAPQHPEAYGIIFGGSDLAGDGQDYAYFLVRQDGKFMIRHRAGTEVHTIAPWTDHAAIVKADADGRAKNTLSVEVGADSIHALVNGARVMSVARAPMLRTDGHYGLRVNHNLEVHVTDFALRRR